MKRLFWTVVASTFMLTGCSSDKKDKEKSIEVVPGEPNAVFLEACRNASTPELQKNLVALVLQHPLVATEDCVLAAKKLSTLEKISLGPDSGSLVDVSLEPLSTLTQLRLLGLSRCRISDLTPIAALPLTQLFLDSNDVTRLDPLGRMTSLESMTIYQNPVTSLAPLATLPNLVSFKFEFSEGETPLDLDEASCPTAAGTNAEIRGECLIRRANGPLWLRPLVGEWAEGSTASDGFRLKIDETGGYEMIAHFVRDGRLVGRTEKGRLTRDSGNDTVAFEAETLACGSALTRGAGGEGQTEFGRRGGTLMMNLKAFGKLTFNRSQTPLDLEAEDCR